MKNNNTRSVSGLAAIGLTMLTIPLMAVASNHSTLETQKEGVELVSQLERSAREAKQLAHQLQTMVGNNQFSKQSHKNTLMYLRSAINDGIAPALMRLSEIQTELPEWKQESINRLLDSAKDLAADANNAIVVKNSSRIPAMLNSEYRETVDKIVGHADNLVRISDAAGDWAKARIKASEAGLQTP